MNDDFFYLQDSHALSQSLPVADKSQDVELISGSEADGITKIRFYRKLVTCDDEDRRIDVSFSITTHAVVVLSPPPQKNIPGLNLPLVHNISDHLQKRQAYLNELVKKPTVSGAITV